MAKTYDYKLKYDRNRMRNNAMTEIEVIKI